jgi:ketosteroid isomerase-like protein
MSDVIERWRRAGEQGDAAAAAACLAVDVVLVSPLTEQFTFRGRDAVRELLAAAFTAVEGIRFRTQTQGDGTYALVYDATVGGQRLEEAQLLTVEAGEITAITLFVRPLPAATALMRALGPEIAKRQNRRGLAAFLRANTAPLHAMVSFGDRRVVPLAAPK